ncbi:MAG: FAD-dependent thymidylate synthase [Crocinitomicaceae bacterium]|nr:FAD-dependent thymidylate synthase [Crocinitomicaceae bacterium]
MTENSVELIGYYGSDETHALSAWTSTSRDLTEEKVNRIGKLLNMLASEGHMTPFEKSSLHFLVTSDIASHIHLLKHRIGVNINAESARYKEFTIDKFYIPYDWPENQKIELENHIKNSFERYHRCIKELEAKGVSRKRAKESARFYLPYGIQITCDIMFNWRSFAHFQKLRNDSHAQVEIRDIAQKMLTLVEETGAFPHTIQAMKVARMLPE